MVQFGILTGKKAGSTWVARRFPVRVGRAADCDLQLEEDGVWDHHLELQLKRKEGVFLESHDHALVHLNGETVEAARLRNGDILELGVVKLRFWLSETRQRGLRVRELLVWIGIGLVTLGQVATIYFLLQ